MVSLFTDLLSGSAAAALASAWLLKVTLVLGVQIALWEWFDIYGIVNDFFLTMQHPLIVDAPRGR